MRNAMELRTIRQDYLIDFFAAKEAGIEAASEGDMEKESDMHSTISHLRVYISENISFYWEDRLRLYTDGRKFRSARATLYAKFGRLTDESLKLRKASEALFAEGDKHFEDAVRAIYGNIAAMNWQLCQGRVSCTVAGQTFYAN